jgi:hypothetical protein
MPMADDTWYELQPDGGPPSDAERFGDRAAAEQAAAQMLARQPDVQCVDIAEYQLRGGARALVGVAGRITAAQPPPPAAAAVDDLHRLPRGDPEC